MSDPRRSLVLLVAFLSAMGSTSPASDITPDSVLRALDGAWHPIDEGRIDIRVIVRRPGKQDSEAELVVFVDPHDRALCEFRSGRQEGRKVLLAGRNAWLIVPGASRAIPITDRHRLVGGVSVADVARLRFAQAFLASERPGDEAVDGVSCRVFDLRARSRETAYASGRLWVGKVDGLARRARLALVSGKEAKDIIFSGYATERGVTVGRRMEFRDLLAPKSGEVTVLEILRYEPEELDASIFDPPRAPRRSRD